MRIETFSRYRKELRTQFSGLREFGKELVSDDLTVMDKLKLIFQEQGLLTLLSLTTVGLLIDVIYNSITGCSGGSGGSKTPPKNENKLVSWVKGKLRALARLLARLGSKAAEALPGIIGSIDSTVFNLLIKTVGVLADYTYTTLLAIGTFIVYAVKEKKRR